MSDEGQVCMRFSEILRKGLTGIVNEEDRLMLVMSLEIRKVLNSGDNFSY